jgi:hypothetical protein
MGIPSYPSLFYILATIIYSLTRIGQIPAPPSEANFRKLLLGALRVPDVAHGFHPALLSRLSAVMPRFSKTISLIRRGGTFNARASAFWRCIHDASQKNRKFRPRIDFF